MLRLEIDAGDGLVGSRCFVSNLIAMLEGRCGVVGSP